MKPKLYLFLLVAVATLGFSCKTASKLYQKGNYDEAVELAAKKLQKDPNDPKLLELIQSSYRYAAEDHERRIRNNSESNNELKYEWLYNEYASLQRLYDAIRKVPQVFELVHPRDYSSYLGTYAEKASEVRYNRGLTLIEQGTGDKQTYRSAYREFKTALGYKPGDLGIQQKMNEAFEYAVVNIIVLPVEHDGFRYSTSSDLSTRNFEDQLLRSLQNNSGSEFTRFYSSWDARSRDLRADEVIDLRFRNMNIGRYYDSRSSRQVSKDVVIREIVYRPDSIVKEYGRVYADITTTNRNMRSEGVLQVNIRDGDGRWLWNDHFVSNHDWNTSFASYTGDARALSESDKQLVNRRAEYPPAEQEIIRCIMQEIESNVLHRLRSYYNRY